MDKLLTKKDLAERWQLEERTIDKYRVEGIITACKGIPAIRFNPQQIAKLEETDLNPLSPLERRRLEKELKEVKEKLNYYKQLFTEFKILIDKTQLQSLKEMVQA